MSDPLFEKALDELLPTGPASKPAQQFNEPTDGPAAIAPELPREQLYAIARGQKWMIRMLLIGVLYGIAILILMAFLTPLDEDSPLEIGLVVAVSVIHGLLSIVMLVIIILLAAKLYSTTEVVLLAVATQLCCAGVIVLLMVNAKATKTLRANGMYLFSAPAVALAL